MNNRLKIGQKIKELRKSQNISQLQLGVALSKSHAAVSDIELGKTDLSVSDLTEIAKFLDVPVASFLEEEKQDQPHFPNFHQMRISRGATKEDEREIMKASNDFGIYVSKLIKEENKS